MVRAVYVVGGRVIKGVHYGVGEGCVYDKGMTLVVSCTDSVGCELVKDIEEGVWVAKRIYVIFNGNER